MKTNVIRKKILIKAPVAAVWRALTDHEEFGAWFRVKLTGPFKAGRMSRGHLTWPGYEHLKWTVKVEAIRPAHYFSFSWHPYAIDPDKDYSKEPTTLVEFSLEAYRGGTRLTLTETGFAKLPPARYPDALRMNRSGWAIQLKNIKRHVTPA